MEFKDFRQSLQDKKVTLVAVSKTKPVEKIMELYNAGQRIFGENRVQELVEKYESLPKDIEWHLIGHLQKNKVKYIAPFVSMIHSVDSLDLLKTIDKEAAKNDRIIPILLQLKIANEETKFGLSLMEYEEILNQISNSEFTNIELRGLMGMASFVEDESQIADEFLYLKDQYDMLLENENIPFTNVNTLSMGMSGDYKIAIQAGSNMVRIGSLLFGSRS
jgi:hypothetical protein